MGEPGSDEEDIARSLELRRALLDQIAAPAREAGTGLSEGAAALLETLHGGAARITCGEIAPVAPAAAASGEGDPGLWERVKGFFRSARERLGF